MRPAFHPIAFALSITCIAAVSAASQQPEKKGWSSDGLPPDAKRLALGDRAPDFRLPGIDGKDHALGDYRDARLLMIVFLSNHCPVSHAVETRLIPFAAEYRSKGLEVVAINPNSPDGIRIDELGYSRYNDSFEEMKLYARDAGFNFPYLYDGELQQVAKAYGGLATPHVFLFDGERRLRYAGRFDDSRFEDPGTVTSHDVRDAVNELLEGRPVSRPLTRVIGCSTKWNEKSTDVALAEERWKSEPVELAKIDADGVARLARNESSRLRLINVWATWCAPCVAEFPELVALARRLGSRDFELVTISMDDPGHEERVRKFLGDHHVAVPPRLKRLLDAEGRGPLNYLYTGASADALAGALDPEWAGPLPHTIVLAPGGSVIYRRNGPIDPEELKNVLLDRLGVYYTP